MIGAFIGVLLGGSMSSDRINEAVSGAMENAQAAAGEASSATQEAIAALGERISALETQISESASSGADFTDQMRARMAEMQDALASRIDALGESAGESTAALRSALEDLSSGIGGGSEGADAGGDGAETAADDAMMDGTEEKQAHVGQTAIFGDGSVRAFVSRIDAESDTARISVNGDLVALSVGEATSVSVDGGDCSVRLSAIDAGTATLASDCGAR